MYYEQQKLGFLQYEELFYDSLSKVVTNASHVEKNKDFYDHFVFKSYERYENSKTENYSIRQIITIFELVLDSMFKYQPSVSLPDDVITIS
jgi:hypothetical protein